MRGLIFYCLFVMLSLSGLGQTKPTDLDKSPLDMSYFPANYPILKMKGQAATTPFARVLYSRPQKKNRAIFGGEVKYNDVWRLGANEATEIEFFKTAKIGKKTLKGRYSMYCIPTENKWTIIFNSDVYSWGSFSYKSEKDVARIDVGAQKNVDSVEAFTMYFEPVKDGASLVIMWDDVKVNVPISF